MKLTTRPAGDADADVIVQLWSAADRARREIVGVPVDTMAGKVARSRLRAPDAFALVVDDSGEPVGMALAMQAREKDGAGAGPVPGLAHVSMVAVHPTRWGQGVGAVAMREIEGLARGQGYTQAQLWTHESNRRGRRLYEGLGWTTSGRTKIDDHGEMIRHYLRDLYRS